MTTTKDFERMFSFDIEKSLYCDNLNISAVVYMFEDIVSGNVYVGTSVNFRERLASHIINARNIVDNRRSWFYNIVRKYGWIRFNVYILERGLTQKQGFIYEKKWIKILDSYHNGYNMTEGGEGTGEGAAHHQARKIRGVNLDTRDEFQWDWIGGAAGDLGISYHNIIQTLSGNNKQVFDFDRMNRYTFKYEEDESDWDFSISPKEIAVITRNIDTKEIQKFLSVSDATRELNGSTTNVFRVLREQQTQFYSRDKKNRYEVQLDPITREWDDTIIHHRDHKNIPVVAYTKEGDLFSIYKSATEASRVLNIERGNISMCALHYDGYRYAGDFIWEFADPDLRAEQKPRKAYKGAVYYIKDDQTITFSTYKSAALSIPDPIYAWGYRVKRIKESISSGFPDSQGLRWYKSM